LNLNRPQYDASLLPSPLISVAPQPPPSSKANFVEPTIRSAYYSRQMNGFRRLP